MSPSQAVEKQINSPARILFASLVGTAIEYFDFAIFATAAVLVFPKLFFSAANPTVSALASLATFGVAFVARPIGGALFGHFGDRFGRKKTLVAALLMMGASTFSIGVLPSYQSIGLAAPLLLALCRFGQGIGLGGEWGGAMLLSVENAPPAKRAFYGMFPQFGTPIGSLLANGTFLLLSRTLTERQLFAFGWRIPFLASSVLVLLGLYVRLSIAETPVFLAAQQRGVHVRVPCLTVFKRHFREIVTGVMLCMAGFVGFYLLLVFTLSWGTIALHYDRRTLLTSQMVGLASSMVVMPLAARLADRGRRPALMGIAVLIGIFGLGMAKLFTAGTGGVLVMMVVGMMPIAMLMTPVGTVMAEQFPTAVRYTGISIAYSLAGIFGASLTPYIATWLATTHGLPYVGYYLSASAAITILGLAMIRETRGETL